MCFDINEMLEVAKTRQGVEGWVVQFENGDMVKIKTDWYLKLHKSIVFLKIRDIAELVINETIDDLKSLLVDDINKIKTINNIEKEIVNDLILIANEVEFQYEKYKTYIRKDVALALNTHQYFSLIMKKFSGQEPPYKEWYSKHILKDKFGIIQI